MRALIRTALDLGWTLVPYEADLSKSPSFDDPMGLEATNWREREQAGNLAKALEALGPDARLLVWCGNAHLEKKPLGDWNPMASQFWHISGIEPFSIDQTFTIAPEGPADARAQPWIEEFGEQLKTIPSGTMGFLREVVVKFVGLESWLRNNDHALYAQLFDSADLVSLAPIEETGKDLDIVELNRHASRIRRAITDDPAQAVGSAKELLETVMKAILEKHGDVTPRDNIPGLLKQTMRELGLYDSDSQVASPASPMLRRTVNNLGQVVIGVSELRNLSGTGHGRSKATELDVAHARLVVNAAITIATYFLELRQDAQL